MTFFIASMGRSGTTWLSSILNQSDHKVAHEIPPRFLAESKIQANHYSPFPARRFIERGPAYGEVNPWLRYHLSPHVAGPEKFIPRRAWLRRDPRRIISSWINNGDIKEDHVPIIIANVVREWSALRDWSESDPQVRVVDMEEATTDASYLQEMVTWLGLQLEVTTAHLVPKNQTPPAKKKWDWSDRTREVFNHQAMHYGLKSSEKF